ncbi:hypothetical protein NDU88_005786 [Pleurodeles waltl]|uniref:RanBP2-type domain-containing protein n=1 Tax=Pleurodeles waltl TaxID=8319 RepID=A0AAV7NSI5_PLEWA|nr:hypothetical protein NDU88_005786 [Pleurodeles waltl]
MMSQVLYRRHMRTDFFECLLISCALRMSSCKTEIKPCGSCHWAMSVTDPHLMCLWCLERDPKLCFECRAINPKALREQSLKLLAVLHSAPRRY